MQYIEIAKSAATVRPASIAAFCIMVAATMPPVSGGRPAITSVRSMKNGQIKKAARHMPRSPRRHVTTVFHCSSSRFMEIIVPR